MTNQVNQAFEKWFSKVDTKIPVRNKELYWSNLGYQTATQASESEINSLKQRVEELSRELDAVKSAFYVNAMRFHPEKSHDEIKSFIEGCVADGKVKIAELTASNNQLQGLCEKIYADLQRGNACRDTMDNLRLALSSTPKQSLAEHDNEVIERCALRLSELIEYESVIEEIRALKANND